MRKCTALLVVAMLVSSNVLHAEILGLKKLTFDGSLEFSGQQAKNETDGNDIFKDTRGATVTRLRIGANTTLTKGIHARIEAVRNSNNGGGVVQFGDGASTVATEEASIAFQNAYVDIDDFLHTDLFRLGRHYGGRRGDLLVYYGPYNDDALTVRALDGLMVQKKVGKGEVTFVTGKVREDDPVANTDFGDVLGDINVTWLNIGSDQLVPGHKVPLEVGIYQGTNSGAQNINDNINLTILDFRVGYVFPNDMASVSLEYLRNGGQRNLPGPASSDFKGDALFLEARYDNKEAGAGIHVRYANASGDNPNATNPASEDKAFHDFRTIGWAVSDTRWAEILSNSNTFAGSFGASPAAGLDTGLLGPGINIMSIGGYYVLPTLDNKMTVHLDYTVASVNEVANAGVGQDPADDGIGTEIDLTFVYDYSRAVRMAFGYALATPERGIIEGFVPVASGTNTPTDDVTKLFAKLKIRWGKSTQRAF